MGASNRHDAGTELGLDFSYSVVAHISWTLKSHGLELRWHKRGEIEEVAAIVEEVSQYNDASSAPKQVSCKFQAISKSNRRSLDDGYNWRKYGQKQVKVSETPRSYYKCSFPSCSVKKKVERSQDGQITEIVYKGTHNHARPQKALKLLQSGDASEHSLDGVSGTTVEEDLVESIEDDDVGVGLPRAENAGGDELDEDELGSKRRRDDGGGEGMSMSGKRTAHETRLVLRTVSDVDIFDDGYRWRKYGLKVLKGNPHPRSYYKCATAGCPVRKHVERASDDVRTVITTYEGKHNHDVPAVHGSAALYHPTGPPADGACKNLAADSTTQSTLADQDQELLDLVKNLPPTARSRPWPTNTKNY